MSYTPLPVKSASPLGTETGILSRAVPQQIVRTTFAKVLASTWDTDFWNRIFQGSGQANSQSSGKGIITSGTTINTETIVRSNSSFVGSFLVRCQSILSQRIVNNNFFVELVDVLGDSLSITVNSATSVTVTFPTTNPFTSENVGQSVYIGALTGFTGVTAIPGRYAIASVAGLTVTFTVASWATGAGNTGTCSLFGWNYHQLLYTGTTPTQVNYDAQRRGWNSGVTTATINTTASPGHMAVMGSEDGNAFLSDQLVASGTTLPLLRRASRIINIAEETTPLFVQIRCVNGTTAPASTTTWTIGMFSIENYASQQVTVASQKAQSANTASPVTVEAAIPTGTNTIGAVNIAAAQTLATVTTVATVTTLANGQTAHSAASTGSPVRVGGRVTATTPATQDQTLVAGDASDVAMSTSAQLLVKPYATAEIDWHYVAAASGIVSSTTAVTIRAASGTAGIRSYITGIEINAYGAGTATELAIRDGAAGPVLWRIQIPTAGLTAPINVNFTTPLRSTANTLLEVVTLTSSATPVYVNAHGYTGF